MAWSQLKNLPVITRGGQSLGQVEGLLFDPETHAIVQYEVRQGLPLARRTLLVAASQVVSITAEQMIVEDLVGKTADERTSALPIAETTASGLATTRKIG
ncbi:MAG: PRC-barrel domain-containing protein [Patescibacteria group bacterium]